MQSAIPPQTTSPVAILCTGTVTRRNTSSDSIIAATCEYFHVPIAILLDTNHRSRTVSLPRSIAMMLVRDWFGYSYPKLGMIFRCDHKSVIRAIGIARRRIREDYILRTQVCELRKIIMETACK